MVLLIKLKGTLTELQSTQGHSLTETKFQCMMAHHMKWPQSFGITHKAAIRTPSQWPRLRCCSTWHTRPGKG